MFSVTFNDYKMGISSSGVGVVSSKWKSTSLSPTLLALFSHEVRTQLTSLRYICDYLRESSSEKDPQWHSILMMNQNIDVLDRLLSDLLFISEWEESNFQLQRERLNFEEFTWKIMRLAREILDEANIKLTLHISGIGERSFLADPRLLTWALLQLIQNAMLYGNHTSTINFTAHRTHKFVKFYITDDGQGIIDEELPHIFERFYRGKSSRAGFDKQAIRGLGQGLYFARAISEAHGGSLEVVSESGSGSTFTTGIPVIETLDR